MSKFGAAWGWERKAKFMYPHILFTVMNGQLNMKVHDSTGKCKITDRAKEVR